MAKRSVDTNCWGDPNFRKLPPLMKLAWKYLCDNCDHAGVWNPDYELMTFKVGHPYFEDDLVHGLGSRLRKLPNGHFILFDFIAEQYGPLTKQNNCERSVRSRLESLGLLEEYLAHYGRLMGGFPNPSETLHEPLGNPSASLEQPFGKGWARQLGIGKGIGKGKGKGGVGGEAKCAALKHIESLPKVDPNSLSPEQKAEIHKAQGRPP